MDKKSNPDAWAETGLAAQLVSMDQPAAAWPHSGPKPGQQWPCQPGPRGPSAAGPTHGGWRQCAASAAWARAIARRRAHDSWCGAAGGKSLVAHIRARLHGALHRATAHAPHKVDGTTAHRNGTTT
jgi:hypothetical protein